MKSKRRYSGNDKHFGPFTFSQHSSENWRPLGIVLDSGGENDDGGSKGCNLKLHAFGYTLIIELPQIIQDYRIKHIAHTWDAATVARMGRNYYFEVFPCEYGFMVRDGFLQVFLGPQTHDSVTTKSWSKFLPWKQWRHVRFSLYALEGEHFWTKLDRDQIKGIGCYEEQRGAEEAVPKIGFEVDDYDGKRIKATTHICEREWRFGDGWFKWLSLFRRAMIKRTLNIEFGDEVGPEKGSWKGGLIGTGIEMLPGELHEAAFRRYCEQEHRSKYRSYRITYVARTE